MRRRCSAERVSDAAIAPFEIWDLAGPEGRLGERLGTGRMRRLRSDGLAGPALAERLVESLLRAAEWLRRGGPGALAPRARRFDILVAAGGWTCLDGFEQVLRATPASFERVVLPDGAFAAEAGGLRILQSRGHCGGVVVDVGQCAVKVSVRENAVRRTSVERDLQRAPLADDDPPARLGRPRMRRPGRPGIDFVAECVAGALPRPAPPVLSAVVALPCELDARCVAGPCTYAGWEGEPSVVIELVESIARRSGAGRCEALALNDAELAAHSARIHLERQGMASGLALVVTLGFGPGAALLAFGDRIAAP
jgi:hypothetical protein